MDSEAALSAFLYFITIVTSLGSAGSIAEACGNNDFLECPARLRSCMAFGFLTAFIAIPLLVACLFGNTIIRRFEIIVSPVVVLFAIIACAIGTSSETSIGITVPSLLVWYSLIPASGAMFLAFKNMEQILPPKEKLVDPNPVSVQLTSTGTNSIPVQHVQQTYPAPAQPMAVGTPYSVPNSAVVNAAS